VATSTEPGEVLAAAPAPARITRTSNAWPISLFALAVFVFILYRWILPESSA
jgi:hypothetical protein